MKAKEILRRSRKSKGYTQYEMAEKLGISSRMYQRYEEGKFPKYKTAQINKIDRLLGTDLENILYKRAPAGENEAADQGRIQLKGKHASTVIVDMQQRIIALEAKAAVLLATTIEILSKQRKKVSAYTPAELSKVIDT